MKKLILSILTLSIISLSASRADAQVKNIVIVHGAFGDGSGWQKVHDILKARGYKVTVAGPPNTGFDQDVAATQLSISKLDGPLILVGHSYGGAIISAAGNDPKVAGLVYVSAFLPEEDETLGKLTMSYSEPTAPGVLPPVNGFLWYDPAKFHADFCADLPQPLADFLADSQMPVAASVFGASVKDPAWRTKPSWQIISTEDHAIPPGLQRNMAKRAGTHVTEIKGSHLLFISHAKEVADVVEAAAKGASK